MAPQRHKHGGRHGSLGPSPALSVPATSQALSRSASLPGPARAGHSVGSAAGSAAGGGENRPPLELARRPPRGSKPEAAAGAAHSRSRPGSSGSGSNAGDDGAAGDGGRRTQHPEQGVAAGAPLAPALKLGKEDVLRCAPAAVGQHSSAGRLSRMRQPGLAEHAQGLLACVVDDQPAATCTLRTVTPPAGAPLAAVQYSPCLSPALKLGVWLHGGGGGRSRGTPPAAGAPGRPRQL